MEAKQIEVLQWWYGNRDYSTGTMLYGKHGKNNVLKNTLTKPGKEKVMSGKLHYELCKAVGLNWKNMPLLPDDAAKYMGPPPPITKITLVTKNGGDTEIDDRFPDPGKRIPVVSDVSLLQYPKTIRRLKMEYQENYQHRSIQHKKMREVPKANTPENNQTRADYLKNIKETSARMDYLYKFIENYENNKVVPLEEEVWPPEKDLELPNDIKGLKRMKQNLQTSNVKDNNLLLYQQKTKADKEKPMPAGAKRTKIELRIKRREENIELINEKLVTLENAN